MENLTIYRVCDCDGYQEGYFRTREAAMDYVRDLEMMYLKEVAECEVEDADARGEAMEAYKSWEKATYEEIEEYLNEDFYFLTEIEVQG